MYTVCICTCLCICLYIHRLWIYVFCLVGQRCQRCQKATQGLFVILYCSRPKGKVFPAKRRLFPTMVSFIVLWHEVFFGILSCQSLNIDCSIKQADMCAFSETAANMITLEDSRYKLISTSVGKLTLLGANKFPNIRKRPAPGDQYLCSSRFCQGILWQAWHGVLVKNNPVGSLSGRITF